MASRSRTSRRLLPSRWRCGPNRRRSIRGPRAAWVFLFRWLTAGVLGLASQCDALGHVQPRMDHEGRQDDEEEKQRKKHVVHLGPSGTSRLSTCWQWLSRPAIQQHGYGSPYFHQVCCTMQQTGHPKGFSKSMRAVTSWQEKSVVAISLLIPKWHSIGLVPPKVLKAGQMCALRPSHRCLH